MKDIDDILDECRVEPGKRFRLADREPEWAGDPSLPKKERRAAAEARLTQDVAALAGAQELLYAADCWAVLLVLQAMDAAGKDGTIKHVMSGVNPQGCQVHSFKQPSEEDLDHTFLWRYARATPERGRIGIFNRSYYEDVLVVKVHADTLAGKKLPKSIRIDDKFWEGRYQDINHFERHLVRNGTAVVKVFLHISKAEQRERFLKRLDDPSKHWKFSAADVAERGRWDDYQAAYEQAIAATSTEWAPWYVVPADHKWVSRAIVAALLDRTIRRLDLSYPEVTPEQQGEIARARQILQGEDR